MTIQQSGFVKARRVAAPTLQQMIDFAKDSKDLTPYGNDRRTRRRLKAKAMNSAILLGLLGAQGCKLVPASLDVTTGAGNGSGDPNLNGVTLSAVAGEENVFSVSEIYSAIGHADNQHLEIVSINSNVGGEVALDGRFIIFTPPGDSVGEAVITIEYVLPSGETRTAELNVDVAAEPVFDEAPAPQPDMTHGDTDHDDNHVDDLDGMDHVDDDVDHGDVGGEDKSCTDNCDDGHNHGPHADDPSKMAEHMAVLDLVAVDAATHIAVNSGSWFDPMTWASGEVPGDGAKVVIPTGVNVLYDQESAASIFTIRVDGELDFATDRNTSLEVDTFVVSPTGKLTIGTIDNPVDANVSAVISFADNGPIDVSWDPMLLSRGLISHGDIQIHGAEKENAARLLVDAMAGDTSLTFDAVPTGWRVGDEIVLTGTHLTEKEGGSRGELEYGETQDERRIITSIDGATVTFGEPLQYNHDGARDDLKAYAANLTRNIIFTTENADDVPVHQRGHVMLMHSDDIDVRYAAFDELGRTDKTERAFDVTELDHVESDSNIKARYSLHIHRAGVNDHENPAMLVGNSVTGVPGWGIVHHDSNAIINSNVVYDVTGAGIVAETGNETGRWADNIVIRVWGVNAQTKNADDTVEFDLGRTGAGYWFQSRMVEAVDNIASDIPDGMGFIYYSRGSRDDVIEVLNANHPQHEALGYDKSSPINTSNINLFLGNEAIATDVGLEVIKQSRKQTHDVRSVIEDFTAWEVRVGATFQYTAHYSVINFDAVVSDSAFLDGSSVTRGIYLQKNAIDFVISNANLEGFHTGIMTDRQLPGLTAEESPDVWQYVFIDNNIIGAVEDINRITPSDRFLTAADLSPTDVRIELNGSEIQLASGSFFLDADKIDSIGRTHFGPEWDPASHKLQSFLQALRDHGYWTDTEGRNLTYLEFYAADRVTGDLTKQRVVVEISDDLKFQDGRFGEVAYNGAWDPDNRAPIGVNDFATVAVGEAVVVDVLANDSDPDGDQLIVESFQSTRGHVTVNDQGALTYTADEHWTGTDVITYWVQDTLGNITEAELTVTVVPEV